MTGIRRTVSVCTLVVCALFMATCGSGDDGPLLSLDPADCQDPIGPNEPNTIYVCDCEDGAADGCVPGLDTNDGMTAQTPLQSPQAIQQAYESARAGRQVALCRGGAWKVDHLRFFLSPECTAEEPCVLADYGAGPLPLLVGQVPEATVMFDSADDEPRRGYVVRNLHITKAKEVRGFAEGIFFFRDVGDITASCLDIHGHGLGVNINPFGTEAERIRVEDSLIHENQGMGFLGGCNDCQIVGNRFHDNGFGLGSAFGHNLYVSASGLDDIADNMLVAHNHLTRSAVNAETGQCSGTSLVAHGGTLSDLVIEYNIVEEPLGGAGNGCWGITVDAATTQIDENLRTIIRGNEVRNVGNVSIGVSSCIDCVIESNLIVQEFIGGAIGIAAPNPITEPPDPPQDNLTIRNNTVWMDGTYGGIGILLSERGDQHVVVSNIVAFGVNAPGTICYEYGLDPSAYDLVDANLGFNCSEVEMGSAGMDLNLLTSDPFFVDPPLDFRLGPDSEARDSANPDSPAPFDLSGKERQGPADRGAFEG